LKQQERQVALHSMLARNAIVIMLALVLAAILIWRQFSYFLDEVEQATAQALVQDKAALLSTRLEIYHDLVSSLASDIEIENMLLAQSEPKASQWAIDHAIVLPDMLGLALITPEGQTLGNAPDLRIGPECLADMRLRLNDQPTTNPPVHKGIKYLEHFDITHVLEDAAGEPIGLILASFKLQTLQSMLDKWAAEGINIRVVGPDGTTLLSSEPIQAEVLSVHVSHPVPGTNWILDARMMKQTKGTLLAGFTATGVIAISVILLILMLMMNRIRDAIKRDYNDIYSALERVHSGEDVTASFNPKLKETADIISSADTIKAHHRELHGLSQTDELTGIANRRKFNIKLPEFYALAQTGKHVAMVMLDLDHFKDLNDKHGHAAGDRVLKLFARILKNHVRQTDLAARFGGDEFIFLQSSTTSEAIVQWFNRLNRHFRQEQKKQYPEYADTPVSCSGGFTFIRPETDSDGEVTMRRTDDALYQAKSRQRSEIVEL
jgi:diguanylate cyclase (GGDEF)-like protein